MASEGMTGQGVKFERMGETDYVPIANVFDINGPGMSREMVELTTFDSDGWRDKISGLRDGGNVTFTMNFVRSHYLLLKEDWESDEPQQYQISIPDAEETKFQFDGYVMEIPMTIPVGDRITANVTIEITGAVTIPEPD